jgi:hypothetical protein
VSKAYRKIVREAQDHWGVREPGTVDWESVDKGLFERLDREGREESVRLANGPSSRFRFAFAGSLALAALLAVFAGRTNDVASVSSAPVEDRLAGVIVGADGRALVNGALLGRGGQLHLGDVIESRGRVTIERAGKLTFVLERDSRVTVTRTEGSLVLALQRGAVEASVVPVATGEAFAVDVDHARVAVHGTHLRVARTSARAVVDLTEGVVSIGPAPRVGTVLGAVIVAPAHAEFALTDAEGTLAVSHDPTALLSLPPLAPTSSASPGFAPLVAAAPPSTLPVSGSLPKADPSAPRLANAPAFSPRSESRPVSPGSLSSPSDAETTAALAAAVRACMAERTPGENVTVVVETTLYLGLQDDGSVRLARFEPPVAPDVNECATPAIYKARFGHGGSTSLVLSYVSK